MSKDVKNTYSRKKSGTNQGEAAFEEARKVVRRKKRVGKYPDGVPYALSPKSKIWCKIGPHSPRKETNKSPEKPEGKGRKRKLQYDVNTKIGTYDPFGFNELEDDVDVLLRDGDDLSESPKKKKKQGKADRSPKKSPSKSPVKANGTPKKASPNKSPKSAKVKRKTVTTPTTKSKKGVKLKESTKGGAKGSKAKAVKESPTKSPKKVNKTKEQPNGKMRKSPTKNVREPATKKTTKKAVRKAAKEPPAQPSPPPDDTSPEKAEDVFEFEFSGETDTGKDNTMCSDDDFEQPEAVTPDTEEASPPLKIFICKKSIMPAKYKGKKIGAVRVDRSEKQLYTIVKNTKQAHECLESGESQLFLDDMTDILDGIQQSRSTKIRCLSAVELISKAASSNFRLGLRAHGYIDKIFSILEDSTSDAGLALCTAAIMFMLTRDRQNIDFNKTILDLLLRLLGVKTDDDGKAKLKEFSKIKGNIRNVFSKGNIKGVETLDLGNLSASVLAQQALLSISSQRTGEWFKDEVRILGGLDHIVDTVLEMNNHFRTKGSGHDPLSEPQTVVHIERCLKLLENVTFKSKQNQAYLFAYKDAVLVDTSIRLLKNSRNWLAKGGATVGTNKHQVCLLTTLRLLLNLTHDNEQGSAKVCHLDGALRTLLETCMQTTEFITEDKKFDTLVLSLGLLINLVEHSSQHLNILNSVRAPTYYEAQAGEFVAEDDDFSTIHALMQLFLVKAEAAKSSSMLTENLPDLNTTISHNTTLRLGPDGLSLYCEDVPNDEEGETSAGDSTSTNKGNNRNTGMKKGKANKKNIGEALEKAGKHMEDSFVASYAALLLGLLAQGNKANRESIHRLLPEGSFTIMIETLTEFLNFTNMTSAAEWSGVETIKEVLGVFKDCQKQYASES